VARGRISRFPVDLRRRPYNTRTRCTVCRYFSVLSHLTVVIFLFAAYVVNKRVSIKGRFVSGVVMTAFFLTLFLKLFICSYHSELCLLYCPSSTVEAGLLLFIL